MNAAEVLKLAKLARIEISDTEAESLSHEFDAILNYVGEVKKISITDHQQSTTNKHAVRNVLRDDIHAHASGEFSEAILKNAPAREGEYIKVKKIL